MTTTRLAPYPTLTGHEPCRQPDTDPDTWFTADSETTARHLCQACPTRVACMAWALDHPQDTEYGVWAGLNPRERAQLRRKFTTTRRRKPTINNTDEGEA